MTHGSDPIRDEIARLEEDIVYTEKAHFWASERLQHSHYWLGGTAAVSSAGSVATILADQPLAAGSLGLVAAVSSGVLTLVKPEERASQHLQSGRALNALRVRLRQARTIGNPDAQTVADFSDGKAMIDGSAPGLTKRAFNGARVKIENGDFTHGEST